MMRERRDRPLFLSLATVVPLLFNGLLVSAASHQGGGNSDKNWRGVPAAFPPDRYPGDPSEYPNNDDWAPQQYTDEMDDLVEEDQDPRRRPPPPPPNSRRRDPESQYLYEDDYAYNDDRSPPPPQSQQQWPSSSDGPSTSTYNAQRPPPPLPGAAAAASQQQQKKFEPIHYNFPTKKEAAKKKRGFFGFGRAKEEENNEGPLTTTEEDDPELGKIPMTYSNDEQRRQREDPLQADGRRRQINGPDDRRRRPPPEGEDLPAFVSPRRDLITLYQSTTRGKLSLALSTGIAGTIVGSFLGKSIMNNPKPLAKLFCGLFLFCFLLRNPYGSLVKALGMALILALQRTSSIRRRYPTWGHLKASIGASPRRPFPPSRNPWTYQPQRESDVEFRMIFTVIAMAFVGSTCGGSVPLIPTWIGSLAGAVFFGLSTTMQSARGDLTRTMGARVVCLVEEFLAINSELGILSKAGVVSGKIFDKLMFLDSKHRIKDRLLSGTTFLYGQISKQVSAMQQDDKPPPRSPREPGQRPPPSRDYDDRRQPPNERRRPPARDYDDRRPPP